MAGLGFIPPRDTRFYLLQAHRQPLPENIAAELIERYTAPNELVIDPFVASDAVVRAALALGRRVLAVDSNPLVAWTARLEATLPPAREIKSALARLGDMSTGGETLRTAVEKLYASLCSQCGESVTVEHFVHTREGDTSVLTGKHFVCAQCGERREDATEADRQRARDAAPRGMHYHLLVQRLLADEATYTPLIQRLLALYTPRNLNALALVTQKLDAEFRRDAAGNVLAGLLLHGLDVGTSLYSAVGAPPARELPGEFVEVNIWRALEAAAQGLSERPGSLRLASTPVQVLESSVPAAFIGQGGARWLTENLPARAEGTRSVLLSSPARLDPSFWEWSFLWTRWLLGKNAATSLHPLLDEKNQRWGWYGEALTNAFTEMAKLAPPAGRCIVAFPSGSHAMIEALMLAAASGFAAEEFAFRPHREATGTTEWGALRGDYQVVWQRADVLGAPPSNLQTFASQIRSTSLAAAREILDRRGEPLAYPWVHHAALDRLAREGVLADALRAKYKQGDNALQFMRHRMEEGFKEGYVHELDHFEEKGRVLWLKRGGDEATSNKRDKGVNERGALAERVEKAVAEILDERKTIPAWELEDRVLERFPGLLTAEIELVELCAGAHADLVEGEWIARDEDTKLWRAHASSLVSELGERLGFRTAQSKQAGIDTIWQLEKIIPGSAKGAVREERVWEDAFALVLRPRVDLEELVALPAAPLRGLVVIPETQVELTSERLRRDPRWHKKLQRAGWEFLRVPMMELLVGEEIATRPEFQLAWGLEPALAQGQEQMQLL